MAIVKRGKKYSVVISFSDCDNHYKQQWFSGFDTEQQAMNFEKNFDQNNKAPSANCSGYCHETISEYLNNWLDLHANHNNLSFNTVRGYRKCIEHICQFIGNLPLDIITPNIMQNLFDDLSKTGLSNTSQLYCYRVLHRCFKWALQRQDIPFNYCDYIDAPKKDKPSIKWLNKDELKRFIDYLSNSDNKVCSLFLMFACCLGLRRGEILGLKWSDFDFSNKSVLIQRSASYVKGGYQFTNCKTVSSQRLLLIPELLFQKLIDHKKSVERRGLYSDERFLFSYENDKIISTDRFQTFKKKALSDIGLPNLRIHDLRHSFASYLVTENSTPINVISKMLGHSKVSTTLDIYTHTDVSSQLTAVSAINNLTS